MNEDLRRRGEALLQAVRETDSMATTDLDDTGHLIEAVLPVEEWGRIVQRAQVLYTETAPDHA